MTNTMSTIRFAILMPWGRVGSNTLLDVVDQYKGMKIVNEQYTLIRTQNQESTEAEIVELQNQWFDKFYSELNEKHQHGGAKFSALSIGDPSRFIEMARKYELNMVYMDRHDIFKTAISAIKAEVYADYHKEKYGKPTWAVKAGREHKEKIHIDTEKLVKYMEFCHQGRSVMQTVQEQLPGLNIFYEDILNDIDHEIGRLLTALSIDPFDYEIAFVKATSDDLTQVISNYEEVMQVVQNVTGNHQLAA